MLKSIADDIKRSFRSGNMVTRLIILNCIIFITLVLLKVFTYDWQGQSTGSFYTTLVHDFMALSSSWKDALMKPWTFLTHMFLHERPWHLVWNMLWLYWFGRILGDLVGDKKVLPIYIMGGLFSAAIYLLSSSLTGWSGGAMAMGASGAVMAITLAAATTSPNYSMRLLILGNVPLKYIALTVVVLDLLGTTMSNSGGHFAHLGGALFGFLYVVNLRNGNNLGRPVEAIEEWISDRNSGRSKSIAKSKSSMKVAHRSKLVSTKKKDTSSKPRASRAATSVDKILDKIKEQGIGSLTPEEKDILDKASKK